MANKSRVKKGLGTVFQLKVWQLIILFVIVSFVAATFLRLNNVGMIQHRDAVIVADKGGNERDVQKRLYDLQRYVSSHMNTDLGQGVYLESSYNRDLKKWQKESYGDSNPHGNIYKKAQEVCAPQFSTYSYAYLLCTTGELEKYPAAANPDSEANAPRKEAYVHDYESATWSPDFAGWSVLVAGLILVLIAIRIISYMVLQLLLRRHYRRV